jgi:hypothetical protein
MRDNPSLPILSCAVSHLNSLKRLPTFSLDALAMSRLFAFTNVTTHADLKFVLEFPPSYTHPYQL